MHPDGFMKERDRKWIAQFTTFKATKLRRRYTMLVLLQNKGVNYKKKLRVVQKTSPYYFSHSTIHLQ